MLTKDIKGEKMLKSIEMSKRNFNVTLIVFNNKNIN